MAIIHTLIVGTLLALGPTTAGVSGSSEQYAAALASVEQAMIEINTDPDQGSAELRLALERLWAFAPLLAEDPAALELRTMAELALARAELARGDRQAAAATIDATLESLGSEPLAIESLGPSLGALVEERAKLLEDRGEARLQIECSVACRVLVDERRVAELDEPGSARELVLPGGERRLWIEQLDGEAQPLRTTIVLAADDEPISLSYPPVAVEAPAPILEHGRGGRRGRSRSLSGHQRVAPRWAELTTLVTGGAALVAGAVLWAIDSRCPGNADPHDVSACPELYDTRNAGIALVSAGFAASLTGGVMLTVDERRVGDRRGPEFALTWTARF